jgi:transposase
LQVRYACDDHDVLRQRLRSLDRDVERRLEQHEVVKLLTTITGIEP